MSHYIDKYMQENDALKVFRFPTYCTWSSSNSKGKALRFLVDF